MLVLTLLPQLVWRILVSFSETRHMYVSIWLFSLLCLSPPLYSTSPEWFVFKKNKIQLSKF